jgi:hypothetical protein
MRAVVLLLSLPVLAGPAFAAAGDREAARPIDPCGESTMTCSAMSEVTPHPDEEEAVVIYLDANGNELVRVPLSRLREASPETPAVQPRR